MNNAERRQKYKVDPEYRAQVIAAVKARHEKMKVNSTYRKLVASRKRICGLRNSIDLQMRRIEKTEERLKLALKYKEKLEKLWKAQQ